MNPRRNFFYGFESLDKSEQRLETSSSQHSNKHVREIAKLFEPNFESSPQFRPAQKCLSVDSTPSKHRMPFSKAPIFHENELDIKEIGPRSTFSSHTKRGLEGVQSKRSLETVPNVHNEYRSFAQESMKHFQNQSRHSLQSRELPSGDRIYQSRTTISKAPNGIRIITEINSEDLLQELWKGSRIETEVPLSKILTEFLEKKNNRF